MSHYRRHYIVSLFKAQSRTDRHENTIYLRKLVGSAFQQLPQNQANIQLRINQKAYLHHKMANPPKPLVICGPSGVGKSTLIKRLTDEFPGLFGFSVSHTSRQPRNGEKDGVNYHYVTKENFLSLKEKGAFIETAEFSGNMYGTSKMAIQSIQEKGQICILDIEMQGVIQIKKIPELDPNYVFVQPPSIEELERRLKERKTETEESLKKRLDTARRELEYGANKDNFDIIIVNEDLDKASAELRAFLIGYIESLQKCKGNL